MSFKLTVNAKGLERVVKKGTKMLKNPRKFLADVGQNEIDQAQRRIKTTKTDPMGSRWASWSPATYESRARRGTLSGGLLYDTGRLYNQFNTVVSPRRVIVYNSSPYAGYLQHGTDDMPGRVYLGWSRKSITDTKRLFTRYMKRW